MANDTKVVAAGPAFTHSIRLYLSDGSEIDFLACGGKSNAENQRRRDEALAALANTVPVRNP